MEKTYRVEQVIEGRKRPIVRGYFYSTPEKIMKALEFNVIGHGTINIYAKTGKVILCSFPG